MSKADPKHGRWILPLVIGGLILFTYLFVEALPPAPVDVTTTSAVAGGDGGEGDGDENGGGGQDGDGTTTTTQNPEAAAFLTAVDDYASRTADLASEAQTINDDYDNGAADFTPTRDALADLQARTDALTTEISEQEVPADATDPWAGVITSSNALSTAAAEMIDGLVNTAGPDQRLAELENYETAAADMATGFEDSRSAVGG